MSYILDALKKSDQQRQRGTAPTLLLAPAISVAPEKSRALMYSLLAIVLVGAGITIGWLRPWQSAPPEPSIRTAETVSVQSVAQLAVQSSESGQRPVVTAALPVQPEMPVHQGQEQKLPTQQPLPIKPANTLPKALPRNAPPASTEKPLAEEPINIADTESTPATTPVQAALRMDQLPLSIQQELPQMTISMHAYSSKPANRLVSINNQLLREGASPAPGVTLEAITPDGMIFSYKEYRFQRGVQ